MSDGEHRASRMVKIPHKGLLAAVYFAMYCCTMLTGKCMLVGASDERQEATNNKINFTPYVRELELGLFQYVP